MVKMSLIKNRWQLKYAKMYGNDEYVVPVTNEYAITVLSSRSLHSISVSITRPDIGCSIGASDDDENLVAIGLLGEGARLTSSNLRFERSFELSDRNITCWTFQIHK